MIVMSLKCPCCGWKGKRTNKHHDLSKQPFCPKCACSLIADKIKVTLTKGVTKNEAQKTSQG